MKGLDTSVVIRLLTGAPETQASRARDLLDEIFESGEKAAVSDLVVSEAYFALQFHYNIPKPEALIALEQFLDSPEIVCIGFSESVLKTPSLESAKPGFIDRVIHSEYVHECGEMVTFEKKASRLENARVL